MNLKQLSQKLGLSQTTVSRALNGYPEVSEATRKLVQSAAKQHNYSPSVSAKSLATGKAHAIGHVLPISSRQEMVNPIFGDFIAGAGETYAKHGYQMVLSIVNDADEEKIYRDLKARRQVDGVIVHAPLMDDPRITLLTEIELPFAVHGRATVTNAPYSWLDVNNRRAFQRATEFLIQLGHRRIALVNGLEYLDFADRRRKGFLDAMQHAGLTVPPSHMTTGEMTEVFGYTSVRAMLSATEPPTAILCSSLISALGVRRAIEERGLVMGRDVSVITHDDVLSYLQNGDDVPIFTATRSSVRDAGRRLAEILLATIANPDAPPIQQLLEAELMIGQSTGPAPREE